VIGTDCTGSCKSNYHTITTTTAPLTLSVHTYFAVVRRTNKLTKLVCKVVKYWNKIKYISKHSFEDVYCHDIIHMYVNYKILLSKPSLNFIQLTLLTSKAALPVQNVKEYLIITKFANILLGFFPFKIKKLFGVLQEYLIINNILLYDTKITGVDCVFVYVMCFQ
jgi:hypothetical protein